MSRVPAHMGTAEKHVLGWLTGGTHPPLSWSRADGFAIYENREFTERLCVALTARGLLDETFESNSARYTVNREGVRVGRGLSTPSPRTGR